MQSTGNRQLKEVQNDKKTTLITSALIIFGIGFLCGAHFLSNGPVAGGLLSTPEAIAACTNQVIQRVDCFDNGTTNSEKRKYFIELHFRKDLFQPAISTDNYEKSKRIWLQQK